MDDDKQDKPGASFTGETGKRAPPTIELTASDVSESAPASDAADAATAPEETSSAAADAESSAHSHSSTETIPPPPSRASSFVLSAVTGAVAAVLVIGAAKLAEWPPAPAPVLTNTANKSDVDALGARLGKVESDVAKPVAPAQPVADPAVTARLGALEKSLTALRDDVAAVRTQSDKTLADIKSASPQALTSTEPQPAPAIDTSAIEERLGKIERATAALSATVTAPPVPQPPAEDPNVRKVGAVIDLEKAMRHGAPYATALAAARSVAGDADTFKALDPFAQTGIPDSDALCKELLALLPQLTPKPEAQPAPAGIIERLQQSFTKLVRVQRTDALASGPAGMIARATSAAQRGDANEAKRELLQLPPSDRVLVRPWIAKVDGRDKALAALDQFTMDTLTAISNRAR